jgi:hypothetical protein
VNTLMAMLVVMRTIATFDMAGLRDGCEKEKKERRSA